MPIIDSLRNRYESAHVFFKVKRKNRPKAVKGFDGRRIKAFTPVCEG